MDLKSRLTNIFERRGARFYSGVADQPPVFWMGIAQEEPMRATAHLLRFLMSGKPHMVAPAAWSVNGGVSLSDERPMWPSAGEPAPVWLKQAARLMVMFPWEFDMEEAASGVWAAAYSPQHGRKAEALGNDLRQLVAAKGAAELRGEIFDFRKVKSIPPMSLATSEEQWREMGEDEKKQIEGMFLGEEKQFKGGWWRGWDWAEDGDSLRGQIGYRSGIADALEVATKAQFPREPHATFDAAFDTDGDTAKVKIDFSVEKDAAGLELAAAIFLFLLMRDLGRRRLVFDGAARRTPQLFAAVSVLMDGFVPERSETQVARGTSDSIFTPKVFYNAAPVTTRRNSGKVELTADGGKGQWSFPLDASGMRMAAMIDQYRQWGAVDEKRMSVFLGEAGEEHPARNIRFKEKGATIAA